MIVINHIRSNDYKRSVFVVFLYPLFLHCTVVPNILKVDQNYTVLLYHFFFLNIIFILFEITLRQSKNAMFTDSRITNNKNMPELAIIATPKFLYLLISNSVSNNILKIHYRIPWGNVKSQKTRVRSYLVRLRIN